MPNFIGVQYLRGIAALSVVVFHIIGSIDRELERLFWIHLLAGGVDIFFVISGFIIWHSTSKSGMTASMWWINRMIRIAPLYWIATLVMVILLWAQGSFTQAEIPSLLEIIRSLLFFSGEMSPVLGVGWTLQYECLFYSLFALTFFIPNRYARFVGIALVFAVMIIMRKFVDTSVPVLFRFTSPLMMEFVAGMLIAIVVPKIINIPCSWVVGLAAITGSLLFVYFVSPKLYPNGGRTIYYGVPAALVVFGIVVLESIINKRPLRYLKFLGDSSYSLYLTHPMLVFGMGAFLQNMVNGSNEVYISSMLLLSLAVGGIAYRYVEQPLLKFSRELVKRYRESVPRKGKSVV